MIDTRPMNNQNHSIQYLLTRWRFRSTLNLAHAIVGTQPEDRFIVAHQRSGITWLRTMLARLVYPEQSSSRDLAIRTFPNLSLQMLVRSTMMNLPHHRSRPAAWCGGNSQTFPACPRCLLSPCRTT
ncbi:MAG: hypothetical protein HC893_14225 [Chloroflexaceae bacterium]|nr:hypothetical protein [Chloroflexaceae bacterium]